MGIDGKITFPQAVDLANSIKRVADYAVENKKTKADLLEAIVLEVQNADTPTPYHINVTTVGMAKGAVIVGLVVVDSSSSQ